MFIEIFLFFFSFGSPVVFSECLHCWCPLDVPHLLQENLQTYQNLLFLFNFSTMFKRCSLIERPYTRFYFISSIVVELISLCPPENLIQRKKLYVSKTFLAFARGLSQLPHRRYVIASSIILDLFAMGEPFQEHKALTTWLRGSLWCSNPATTLRLWSEEERTDFNNHTRYLYEFAKNQAVF